MIVMDMEHAKMANVFAILDTLVYHAIVIWIEVFCLHLLYLFELQKLLVRKYAVLMVFAYKTNAFVMLDTVDQIAQFKVKFLSEKGCVNYILFFTFSRTKMPWKL